jgi:hypothetical protein
MELDEIEQTAKPAKGNHYILPIATLAIILGAGYFFLKDFQFFPHSNPAKPDNNYAPYVDFAENFVIAFNNISYVNQDQQRAALADMMTSDLLTSYQNSFYDPAFLKMIADNRIYITFQKVTRSEVVLTGNNEAAVKVIGFDLFHSDATGSQKEKPFTYQVDVVKAGDGKFQVSKIEKL